MLGDEASGKLLALRRLSFGGSASTKLRFSLAGGRVPLTLRVVSDAYLGLDQRVQVKWEAKGVN